MLIFLLFSDQISGGGSLRGGGELPQGPPVDESQVMLWLYGNDFIPKYVLDI